MFRRSWLAPWLLLIGLCAVDAPGIGERVGSSRAQAAMQSDFDAGLTLWGGYDSNVLFDGMGGDRIGRAGLNLRALLYDRRWSAAFDLNASALGFDQRQQFVFLGEGRIRLIRRFDRHTVGFVRSRLRAADDPLALAQIGMLGVSGRALSYRNLAGLQHRITPRLGIEWSLQFDGVELLESQTSGAPGGFAAGANVRAHWRWTRPLTLNNSIEGRIYSSDGWLAESVAWLPGVRWRLARRTFVEVNAGALAYFDDQGFLPFWVGRGTWTLEGRRFGAEVVIANDLTVPAGRGGLIAGQIAEGIVRRGTERTELRMRGGFYRSHPTPRDDRWVPGYGLEAAAFVRVLPLTWMGIGVMRFERLATDREPAESRNAIHLRVDLTSDRP